MCDWSIYIHMFQTILANDWQMSKEKYPVERVTKLRCFIQTNPLEEIVDCVLTILDQGNGVEHVANLLPTCMMSWWLSVLPLPEHRNNGSLPLVRWCGSGRVEVVKRCELFDHDDVIKWKYFPRYWPFVWGIHRSSVNSPHKGQWRGALMFSLICAWINDWVNNREAGDLRRHLAHCDVIVMQYEYVAWQWFWRLMFVFRAIRGFIPPRR